MPASSDNQNTQHRLHEVNQLRRNLTISTWLTPVINSVILPAHAQTSAPKPPLLPAIIGNIKVSQLHFRQVHNRILSDPVVQDEYVDVMNCDTVSVNISNWVVRCTVGGGTGGLGSFTFPSGLILAPNQVVRIWTHAPDPADPNFGSSGAAMNFTFGVTGTAFSQYNWNNSGDAAELLNSIGAQVDLTPTYSGNSASPIFYSC